LGPGLGLLVNVFRNKPRDEVSVVIVRFVVATWEGLKKSG